MRKLGDWIEGFLQFTSNTDPCLLYREWTAVSTIAAVLQGKVWFLDGRYRHSPILYIVLVGPPAAKKGTAISAGEELLEAVRGVRFASSSVPGKGLIKELKAAEDQTPYLTPDGVQDFIFHSSLTVFAREFSIFIGRERPEFLDWLCDWFDYRTEWSDTALLRDSIILRRPWLNIIGATTERHLKDFLPRAAIGGGFTSRCIFVYDSGSGNPVYETAYKPFELELRQDLIHDLEIIKMIAGEITWSNEARELYITWRKEQDENPPWLGTELEYYVDRRMVHVCRVAAVMSASRSSDMEIKPEDVLKSIDILERTEVNMPRVFSTYGRSDIIEVVKAIQRSIIRNPNGQLTSRYLLQQHIKDIHSSKEFNDILHILERQGFIRRAWDEEKHDYAIFYTPPEDDPSGSTNY